MDIQMTKEQIRELFIETEKNCSLCGSELKLIHDADFVKQTVIEQSVCKSCGIRSKKRDFVLQ